MTRKKTFSGGEDVPSWNCTERYVKTSHRTLAEANEGAWTLDQCFGYTVADDGRLRDILAPKPMNMPAISASSLARAASVYEDEDNAS